MCGEHVRDLGPGCVERHVGDCCRANLVTRGRNGLRESSDPGIGGGVLAGWLGDDADLLTGRGVRNEPLAVFYPKLIVIGADEAGLTSGFHAGRGTVDEDYLGARGACLVDVRGLGRRAVYEKDHASRMQL